jgi:hypothetical protein
MGVKQPVAVSLATEFSVNNGNSIIIIIQLFIIYVLSHWWENQKERDHWEDQHVGGWTILKWILREMVWTGSNWLRIGTSGKLLGIRR